MRLETEFLADQLHRSCFGDAWHGPALLELLSEVHDEQFDRRARERWHSIREIVLHIMAWESAALGALHGTNMPPLNEPWQGDWPVSDDPRDRVVASLRQVSMDLEQAVRNLPPDKLSAAVPGRDHYDFRFLLNGIVQHNLYHAGQIALLRK